MSAAARPIGVGVVGTGSVSERYLRNLTASPHTAVIACADQDLKSARRRAAEFGVARACTTDQLLDDPEVEMVVNLTNPSAHAEVSLAALEAGKHVYSEKPLATNRADARRILEAAARAGLTVGCAPHTFLGAGLQTCLKLLGDGHLGEPLAAGAFMFGAGPESWHPNPAFLYQPGGGPLLDMGPYYITTLVCMFGPVRRVASMARILHAELTPHRGPRQGETFKVTTPTYVSAILEFVGGEQATLVTTFGIPRADQPHLQVYCSHATLSVPDPNTYGGPVRVRLNQDEPGWSDVILLYGHTVASHGYSGLGA
ncbi:MAG TPA: Gfo/Idh/MocA family oxidoreductase, partial [Candidatus Dormibacteraeota bacterium]